MSEVTNEAISYSAEGTLLRVTVSMFQEKMFHWTPGKSVTCTPFYHDDIKLQLKVYPNGHVKEDVGYVSIYLRNLSTRRVFVEGQWRMKNYKNDISFPIDPSEGKGHPKFFNHDFVRRSDTDEELEIEMIINKVLKNYDDGMMSQAKQVKEVHYKMCGMESSLESLIREMKSLKTSVDNVNINNNNDDTKRRKTSGWNNFTKEDRNRLIPKPECQVCMEEMTPDTQIAHCVSGHFICWSCKSKVECCPTCKNLVMGRAFGIEKYIKTLFV